MSAFFRWFCVRSRPRIKVFCWQVTRLIILIQEGHFQKAITADGKWILTIPTFDSNEEDKIRLHYVYVIFRVADHEYFLINYFVIPESVSQSCPISKLLSEEQRTFLFSSNRSFGWGTKLLIWNFIKFIDIQSNKVDSGVCGLFMLSMEVTINPMMNLF